MRIGLLTTSFPRFENDVAGQFVLGFARALAARGHSFEVLAPEPSQAFAAPRWPGVEVHFVPYLRPRGLARTFYGAGVPDNLLRDPRAWLGPLPFTAALYRAARARRAGWDAVVSHWALPCGLIAGAIRERRPHLAVLHSADLQLLARLPLRRSLAARLAASSDQLLFVSEAQRSRFMAWLNPVTRIGVRSTVQAMGIDATGATLPDRAASRERLGLDGFTLLTIGRLVPIKGLVAAVRELAARADLTWLIAGDGPERARLLALAREVKLRVRLLGLVHGDAKATLLQAADAFVLPSRVLASGRSEGVPTALLEAMAAGLPPIAACVGGVPEVVRDAQTGLLFDPEKPGALAACIDRLIAAPELVRALGERARVYGARYEWNTLAPALGALIEPPGAGRTDPAARLSQPMPS
jgi:glycosyltransferase involved in cell wall biosynthesis